MRIGFDIDDTLNNIRYTFIQILNRDYQLHIPSQFIDSFGNFCVGDTLRFLGIMNTPHMDMWNRYIQELMETNLPLPHTAETLQQLKKDGHEIYYVTARTPDYRETTTRWLKHFGFPYQDDHLFVGMKDLEKVHIIQEQKIDIFFDDRVHIVESVTNGGIRGVVKNQCYNREWQGERIYDWTDIYQFISNT